MYLCSYSWFKKLAESESGLPLLFLPLPSQPTSLPLFSTHTELTSLLLHLSFAPFSLSLGRVPFSMFFFSRHNMELNLTRLSWVSQLGSQFHVFNPCSYDAISDGIYRHNQKSRA
eukprot:TRINITY_DN3558_c0_g1_i1.p1 TRINITY_DN3558_c0_g1~~TRINITY_DN3558_c0_g1_i1.p1  ORF type:complete len:115 (-),score=1.60 TRINITY_DN3558_c0_g1_i1:22-366(-)